MTNIEVINQAIAKFEAIPENMFCVNKTYIREKNQCCFIGHLGVGSNREFDKTYIILGKIFVEHLGGIGMFQMIDVNNGNHPDFQQPTVKGRILAALYEVKRRILIATPPVDEVLEPFFSDEEMDHELVMDYMSDINS